MNKMGKYILFKKIKEIDLCSKCLVGCQLKYLSVNEITKKWDEGYFPKLFKLIEKCKICFDE
jgi:hypothetical protein